MNTPQTPFSRSASPAQRIELAAWVELRDELAKLNARLEYVRLLLRIGVKPF